MKFIRIKWMKSSFKYIAICIIGVMCFDSAEYHDKNEFLDGETGLISGVIINLSNVMRNCLLRL